MKKLLIAFILISGVTAFGFKNVETSESLKTGKLTVRYSFANIEEGYDHLTKTEVYLDGNLAGTSTIRNQSEENVVICEITRGMHHVRIINYAYYEGVWEEHTLDNSYSIDCKYESEVNLKKKNNKITLLFDIDKGTTREK